MLHPLLGNLNKIKDADLEAKILELSKKYVIAARMGQGGLADQILMVLEAHKEEQSCRHDAAMKKVIGKQDKDLDDLINVE